MVDHLLILGLVVVFVNGALLVMWIGLITEHGVGNGASPIIMAGIIAGLPAIAA